MRPALVLTFAGILLAPAARAAGGGDMVGTLERSMHVANGRSTVALTTSKHTVTLLPGGKSISVQRAGLLGRARGPATFTLGENGKLSDSDHSALHTRLSSDPGASRGAILGSLRASINGRRAADIRTARLDDQVRDLLGKATVEAGETKLIFQRGSSTVQVRDSMNGPLLIVSDHGSEHALYLRKDATDTLSLDPAGHEELGELLGRK